MAKQTLAGLQREVSALRQEKEDLIDFIKNYDRGDYSCRLQFLNRCLQLCILRTGLRGRALCCPHRPLKRLVLRDVSLGPIGPLGLKVSRAEGDTILKISINIRLNPVYPGTS